MKRGLAGACALIVVASPLVALSGVAGAVATPVDMDCVVSAPVVGDQPADQSIILDATAPSSVPPGATFPIVVSASPIAIPASLTAGGFTVTINNAKNLSLKLPVPANSTFVSSSLSGGAGLGAGVPTVGLSGADVVVNVPGPIPGGSSVTLPTVTMTVVASATTGAVIEPRVGGTTPAAPGYQMTVNAAIPVLGNQDVPLKCAPKAPNPALSTTTIGNVGSLGDVSPPTVTLTTPAHGGLYGVGQVVNAAFSCTDNVAIQTCTGTVANGAAINTSTAGAKTFTVNATDTAGNPTTVTNTYYVKASPVTTIGPNQAATLTASGSTNVNGAAARVKVAAPAANGGQLKIGDAITIDWSIYHASLPSNLGNTGPSVVNWTLPTPTNTTINGAVVTDETGLGSGETKANAYKGSATTGLTSITPSANPSGATQLALVWDANSSPTGAQQGDGIVMHVRFTATVTATGTVQIQGFPGLTGTESAGTFSTTAVTAAQVGISYTAIDATPPTINIAAPAHGAVVNLGQVLNAGYSCSDNIGVPTCVGTVANGAPVNTSTVGVKQFTVNSTDGSGLTATKTNTYTVVNGTFSQIPTVSASSCQGTEGGSCAFTVSLSNVYGQVVTVAYATQAGTAGTSDYTTTSGTLTFGVGETTKPVSVPLSVDAVLEGDETFALALSSPTNAILGTNGTGTIHDATVAPTVSASSCQGNEGGTCAFTVSLSSSPTVAATVAYSTQPGTASTSDYTTTSGTLTFAIGETSKPVSVALTTDAVNEADETFTLALSSPTNAVLGTNGTGTIHNVAAVPLVSASNCQGTEAGTCAFTVSLSVASAQTVTVAYAAAPGTAGPSDYTATSGTLTYTPGQLSKPVNVALTDDALDEPDEAFILDLANPTNAIVGTNGTGVIHDGSVTYTASYDAATGATLQAAATFYGIPFADVTRTGGTLIAFLTALSGGPAGPLAPPNNSGPVSVTATYTQADAVQVNALAASYGLNGNDMHWYGGYIIGFFYLLSPH